MSAGNKSVLPGSPPLADDSFQKLLLAFTEAATQGIDPPSLIRLFCVMSREFFRASGAYYWEVVSPNEVVATEADGHLAARFRGLRLNPREAAATSEAINTRRTVYVNAHQAAHYRLAHEFGARSVMAAPLVVFGEVIGTAVFIHTTDPDFFNEDAAAKATILAAQLGSLLETKRLSKVSAEEHRRAEILVQTAQALHHVPDAASIIDALADRLRSLMNAHAAVVMLQKGDRCVPWGSATENPRLSEKVYRWLGEPNGRAVVEDLARRAIRAGVPVTVAVDAAEYGFLELSPSGVLVGAPLQTTSSAGAVILFPASGVVIHEDEKRIIAAMTSLASLAVANAELFESVNSQARDLKGLLAISSELSRISDSDKFLQQFVLRAAEFLGFRRAFVALPAGDSYRIRWSVRDGQVRSLDFTFPKGVVVERLSKQEIFWTDDLSQIPGVNMETAAGLDVKQLLAVPLVGSDGTVMGIFGVLDRKKDSAITSDDLDRARALAAQISIAIENSRLFTKMEQANRHWIEIFDAISDFIVVHDENHKVLRVNCSLAEFIGVTPPELIGVNMGTLLAHSREAPLGYCPFCRAGSAAGEYVDPVLERTYLVSTSRIHGAENDGLQTIHVLKDITDRREAERRYHELLDNIQEGLYFSSADGRFIEVNDALVRMLGYESRNELLQIDIPNQLYITPAHRTRFRETIEEAGVLRNYQEALRKKDGSLIHTLQNVFAVRDHQGKVIQYRGVMLDITELKNSQFQLQHERDLNTKILNNTQSMILVADTSGVITYTNRRSQVATGYNQEQIVGRPLVELITPARRDSIDAALRATLGGQQVDNLELPLLRSDGRLSQFSINLSPMRDEGGQVSSIVVVMTDITDAAMLQAKLMHTEKMAAVGHLVSGVAHEVNNPLTAILGFADLLMESPQMPDSAKNDLRVILQEAQRTKQIVQNLLSFARQMPPQRKPVQLNSVLRRTLQLRSYDFASHGVEVEEILSDTLPEVIGDSHQIQQVFLNILNNAYDAVRDTGRPPRISLETRVVNGFAEIVFRDNGNGIAHADRIFDPFFTTKGVGEGTGLGLSICYGIVREHGGEIACYNNPDGNGATFIVRLPLATDAATSRPAGVTHEHRTQGNN